MMHKISVIPGRSSALRVVSMAGLCALALLLSKSATAQGPQPVIYIDQAWSQADRETFYQISQGSAVMSYDIFLNLEASGSQDLFRSDANSERYGLITQPANPRTNPDALPIGLSKTVIEQGPWKGEHIGLTCAACHNAQLNYKGQRIRVDGGVGNTFDFIAYVSALDDAMQATQADAAKFDRLAARMGATTAEAKSALRQRFEKESAPIHHYRTRTIVTPATAGPSRMDAIGLIVNRLAATEPNIPENWSTGLAPTKPPFLWNAPQGSWTQWRGTKQDPISRNLTETMGVFMPMNLHAGTPDEGLFDSNAKLLNLQKIEDMLSRLAPPKWPQEVFGAIDRDKAAAGKKLFMKHCAGCHNAWPYTWTEPNKYGKRFVQVGLVPQKVVGTDPGQFDDLRPYAITAQLAPNLPPPFKDKPIIPTGALYVTMQESLLDTALAKLKLTEEQTVALHGYREFPLQRQTGEVYKAAPRDGVWATPPFMHNGSVPNLYEMLIPAKQRTKQFYVGREFDPVKVGLDTSGNSGKFLLDTTQRGNSNAGHSFESGRLGNGVIGPLLSEKERWALVEYLKSIPEEPGRVTVFGGPPDAKSGKPRWSEPPTR